MSLALVKPTSLKRRSSYWVPMVGHAFKVLEAFYDAGMEISLQEISSRAGVSKTSALRILFTLHQLGYVDRNEETGKYQLGFKVVELARETLGRTLVQITRPYMQQLHVNFNETVNLAVLRNHEIVYVQVIESGRPFRMVTELGSRAPIHATALGKAIVAFLPENDLQLALKSVKFQVWTPRTISTIQHFRRELQKVHKRGYGVDNEEHERGAFCIASPVVNNKGHAIAAVSITGPTHRIKPLRRNIVRQLKRVCAALTRTIQIGGLR